MSLRLPRLQLFEFNDLPWMPAAVRDTVVESLSRTLAWGGILEGLVGPFEAFLARAGAREVLEIGSGGGGPAIILAIVVPRTIFCPRFPCRVSPSGGPPRRQVQRDWDRVIPVPGVSVVVPGSRELPASRRWC